MEAANAAVLDAIAATNERLVRLASLLRRKSGVKEVRHALTLAPFRSPGDITLDIYVDAELPHGPGLVWSLGAWWHPQWGVEGSVRFVYGEDAEDVCRLLGQPTTDVGVFMAELERVVDGLVAVADGIDLAKYEGRLPDP